MRHLDTCQAMCLTCKNVQDLTTPHGGYVNLWSSFCGVSLPRHWMPTKWLNGFDSSMISPFASCSGQVFNQLDLFCKFLFSADKHPPGLQNCNPYFHPQLLLLLLYCLTSFYLFHIIAHTIVHILFFLS